MLAFLQEDGIRTIPFVGLSLKLSSCRVLKLFLSVFFLMVISMLWWITFGIERKLKELMWILLGLM